MLNSHGASKMIIISTLAAIAVITLTGCPQAAQPLPTPTGGAAPATPTPDAPAGTPTVPVPTVTPNQAAPQGTAIPGAPPATPAPTEASPTPPPSATQTPTPKQAGCPNLESRLYRLTTADDPAAYAAGSGLQYSEGRVRVVIEFQGPNDSLPAGYDVAVEARQGNLVQARAPVQDLCRISNEPNVRFVRAPIEPVR